jgi:hypothetical protein
LFQVYNFIKEKSRVKLTYSSLPDPRKISLNLKEFERVLDVLIDNLYKDRKE